MIYTKAHLYFHTEWEIKSTFRTPLGAGEGMVVGLDLLCYLPGGWVSQGAGDELVHKSCDGQLLIFIRNFAFRTGIKS